MYPLDTCISLGIHVMYPWEYMYPQGYMYPRDTCISGDTCFLRDTCIPGDRCSPQRLSCTLTTVHPSASQCITLHPSASQCITLHETSSDSIRLSPICKSWRSLENVQNSSWEVSRAVPGRSQRGDPEFSGPDPKFQFSKNGVFKKVPGAISDGR